MTLFLAHLVITAGLLLIVANLVEEVPGTLVNITTVVALSQNVLLGLVFAMRLTKTDEAAIINARYDGKYKSQSAN